MIVIISCVIMYIIAFGIGKFNELCPMWVNIPEYISLIISGVIIILNVFLLKDKKKHIILKISNIVLSIIAIIVVNLRTYCNPFWNSITWKASDNFKTMDRLEVVSYEEAKEDVDYAMKYLKKVHPAFIKDFPKEIEQEYNKVIDGLKMDKRINVETVYNAIDSIYSKMEDSHTHTGMEISVNGKSNFDNNKNDFVKYNIDTVNSSAILTLDECIFNKYYTKCVNSMFKEVKENNIQNVIVDLRNNGGGSSFVVDEFIKYIDVDKYKYSVINHRLGKLGTIVGTICNKEYKNNNKYEDLLFKGNVYLLTSNNTCSAAMTFTDVIQGNKLGVIVGESPGDLANYYTDKVPFLTPNTRIVLYISFAQQYAVTKNLKDGFIQPDIECDADDALDKAKEIINKK